MITLNRSFIAASLLVLTVSSLQANVKELSNVSEYTALIQNQDACIVDYYTDWCSSCKIMAPDFEAVSAKNGRISFAKANLDKEASLKTLVKQLNIKAYPTTIFYKKGKEVYRIEGGLNQAVLQSLIDSQLTEAAPKASQPQRPVCPKAPVTQAPPAVQPQPRRTRLIEAAPKPFVQPQAIKVAQRPAVVKTSTFRRS